MKYKILFPTKLLEKAVEEMDFLQTADTKSQNHLR